MDADRALDGRAAVEKYEDRSLLIVWPDFHADWPAETLAVYRGSTVVYVGEGEGGCTGDEAFHKLLDDQFSIKEQSSIPQFLGVHDYLEVRMRRR